METYDFLIIGAGLAGLHCALQLSSQYPNASIAICESYFYIGGRVVSYSPKDFKGITWENGAGRIHSSHSKILDYCKKYNLTLIPIGDVDSFLDSKSNQISTHTWNSFSSNILRSLSKLNSSILESHTLVQLLEKLHLSTAFLKHFPYSSEFFTLRADLALLSFQHEFQSNSSFYGVKESLGELIKRIVKDLKSRNVTFLLHHTCLSISPSSAKIQVNSDSQTSTKSIGFQKCILSVHSNALQKISPFQNYNPLSYLSMEPLLRIYAIFKSPAWFADIPKLSTDSPLRFIIPINPKKGVLMISYTDGKDAKKLMKLLDSKESLQSFIIKEIRRLFPLKEIPDPLFFKAHPWYDGCTYWLPGHYSPQALSKTFMHPLPNSHPNVYVCGESYSMKQAWMEGALEHADSMLKKYF
jgi:monoamine oxidase